MKRTIGVLRACAILALLAGTAQAQLPGNITLVSPADAATDLSVTPTFKWRTEPLSTSYRILISLPGGATIINQEVVDTMYTVASPLDNGQEYRWTVRGLNSNGDGVKAPARSFITVAGGVTQVDLTSPANGATDVAPEPVLTWGSVPGAASYHLQVSTSAGFGTTVVNEPALGATQYQASLDADQTYYWRVKASNAAEHNWSATWSFTTGSGKPAKIVLSSPTNGATNVSVTPNFMWDADPVATQYRIQVAENSDFSTIVHNILVATNSWTSPALENATTYWWRVRGINGSGSGLYSDSWSFETEAGGSKQVQLLSPSNGATGVDLDPVLTWAEVSGGSPYRIQVSTVSNFSSTIVDDSNVNATQYQTDTLAASTTHYWRVRAKNAAPDNWSETWSFTTGSGKPAKIVLSAPADGATDVPISTSFSWQADQAADTYRLQVSAESDFSSYVINQQGITGTSYQPPDVLDQATMHYWRVRGINEVGSGPYSTAWSFTTVAAAPGVVNPTSPANGATGVPVTPTLVWDAEPLSDTYDLQIALTADFASPVVSAFGISETEFTSAALAYGTQHFWRVRGSNTQGSGPWTSAQSFTTIPGGPLQVQLTSPSNNATDVSLAPLFQWGAVGGAASYTLQVSKQSNFSSTVINRDAVTATQFQASNLEGNTKYYWRVKASNAGPANWSDTWSFTTAVGAPDKVTLASPADHTFNVAVDIALAWNQAQKADSYEIQISRKEDDFTELYYEASGIGGTQHKPDNLVNGDVYWWRVRAVNENGPGDWSDPWGFLTERGGPHQPLIVSPVPGETGVSLDPLLVWTQIDEDAENAAKLGQAVTYHVQVATQFNFANGSIILEESGVPDTMFQATGLEPDMIYAWRVRASVAAPNNWTITSSFVTGEGEPGQVVLDSPANGASDIPLETELKWTVPPRATSFNLQVSLDAGFNSVIVSESELTDIAYQIVGLGPATNYYWRVQAVNQEGLGDWSETWVYTTVGVSAPTAPTLISPLNGATEVSTTPLFTWNASEQASSYKLEISTNPTFSTVAIAVVVTQPFYQADGLSIGQGYFWRVEARNAGGEATSEVWGFTTVQSTDTEDEELPAEFALQQNYPNPFNPSTTLEFSMPVGAEASLIVYDISGKEVARLVDGFTPAGVHRIRWNAADLPSGVYIYRFQADRFVSTRKLTLTK